MKKDRALVVDDDPSWREILKELLEDCGFQVDEAENLEIAQSLLREFSHRLAVVDLSLDESDHRNQDGLRILDLIEARDPNCQTILLTGYATVELAVSVLTERKAITCLRKESFSRTEFLGLLQKTVQVPPKTQNSGPRLAHRKHGWALVVDDDAGWRELLGELLEEGGLGSANCASFAEARSRLEKETFSLAVVDLQLASSINPNNRDGLDLLSLTRQAKIPSIVVSGTSPTQLIDETFRKESIAAFFEKQNFSRQSFVQTVEECLTPSVLDNLTDREREVLDLLAEGLTNQGIGEKLFISANTVKRHLKSVFEKLGVGNRAAAAALVTRVSLE